MLEAGGEPTLSLRMGHAYCPADLGPGGPHPRVHPSEDAHLLQFGSVDRGLDLRADGDLREMIGAR